MRLPCILLSLLLLALPTWAQELPAADGDVENWGSPVVDGSDFIEDETPAATAFAEHVYDPKQYSEAVQEIMSNEAPPGEQTSAELLREILSSPAFQDDVQPDIKGETLLDRLLLWLTGTLGKIGKALGMGGLAGQSVLVYVVAILALALMAMLIRQLIMNSGTRGGRRRQGSESELPDGSEDLLGLAELCAREGDYRMALRYRYLEVLQSLDLPSSALTTNSMLIREVLRGHPQLHREFRSLVELFEDAWYGSLETGRSQYTAAAGLAGSLDRQIRIRQEAQS